MAHVNEKYEDMKSRNLVSNERCHRIAGAEPNGMIASSAGGRHGAAAALHRTVVAARSGAIVFWWHRIRCRSGPADRRRRRHHGGRPVDSPVAEPQAADDLSVLEGGPKRRQTAPAFQYPMARPPGQPTCVPGGR